jgi:hypothetical protein
MPKTTMAARLVEFWKSQTTARYLATMPHHGAKTMPYDTATIARDILQPCRTRARDILQ